jgi:hypothetical protein
MRLLNQRQTARARMRLGKRTRFEAEVDVSAAGLLSITALVCGILLSTTVLVTQAIRESRR